MEDNLLLMVIWAYTRARVCGGGVFFWCVWRGGRFWLLNRSLRCNIKKCER